MGRWLKGGLGAALVAGAIWWFTAEPPDPFAASKPPQILADPKQPPDAEPFQAEELEKPKLDNKPQPEEPEKAPENGAKPACPPGDPMCGGL